MQTWFTVDERAEKRAIGPIPPLVEVKQWVSFFEQYWDSSIDHQSMVLNDLIRSNIPNPGNSKISLLDCSCGIGTQAIGLAKREYLVTATDLSAASIQRAKREAESRGNRVASSTQLQATRGLS